MVAQGLTPDLFFTYQLARTLLHTQTPQPLEIVCACLLRTCSTTKMIQNTMTIIVP